MAVDLDRISYIKTQAAAQDHWTVHLQVLTQDKMLNVHSNTYFKPAKTADNPLTALSRIMTRLKSAV